MVKIGISINGVLRDFFGKIEKTHTKYFNPDSEIKILDYDLERWLVFPKNEESNHEITFNPNFTEESFVEDEGILEVVESKNEETTIEDFLYHKCCLEIFGYSDETEDGVVQSLNNFILDNKDKYEFTLISREIGRSIPATLFFLSKTGCMVNNVKFVLGETDCWDYVDCMITDNPKILLKKPEGKYTIKIQKDFNKDISSDYTVNTIKEISDLIFFK